MLVKMPENRNAYTLLVGMQINTTTMENSMEIPQKAKHRTAMIQCHDSWASTQRKVGQDTLETPVHSCSSQHYSQ
jgi:hypothetical protein